jgi:hypothetical protein
MYSSIAGPATAITTATHLSDFVSHYAHDGGNKIGLLHRTTLPEAAQPRDCGVHSLKPSTLGERGGNWRRLLWLGALGRSAFRLRGSAAARTLASATVAAITTTGRTGRTGSTNTTATRSTATRRAATTTAAAATTAAATTAHGCDKDWATAELNDRQDGRTGAKITRPPSHLR